MDYIRRYLNERDDKDIFLKRLAEKIKSLEKTKIDYTAILKDISADLREKTGKKYRIEREYKVGDKVMVSRSDDVIWNKSYRNDRDEAYPKGTIGEICEIEDEEHLGVCIYVKFETMAHWRQVYNGVTGHSAGYKSEELKLLREVTDDEYYNQFLKKVLNFDKETSVEEVPDKLKINLLAVLDAEKKHGLTDYQRNLIILYKDSKQKMKAYNMTDEEIDDFFKQNLSEVNYKRVTSWQGVINLQNTGENKNELDG